MTDRLERLLRAELRAVKAYHVQASSPQTVKLDAMENPYELPKDLRASWVQELSDISLNRYPDASADELRNQLKQVLELPSHFELILGNGSDELIQLLCMALIAAPKRKSGSPVVLAPEPGFAMYRLLALAAGLDYVGVPLLPDSFQLDMPAMLQAIKQHDPEIIFLAYPNNPTGNVFNLEDIELLAKQSTGLLIIDEAYHPFAQSSAIDVLCGYEHVLLLRTLSKLGLAGIRLGVLSGAAAWLEQLNKLRLPYNINILTQATAQFACRNYEVFLQQSMQIREQRQELYLALEKIEGVTPYTSQANFILFRVDSDSADSVFNNLLQQHVLIKNLSHSHPLLRGCLRVTVGSPDENKIFLSALHRALS